MRGWQRKRDSVGDHHCGCGGSIGGSLMKVVVGEETLLHLLDLHREIKCSFSYFVRVLRIGSGHAYERGHYRP